MKRHWPDAMGRPICGTALDQDHRYKRMAMKKETVTCEKCKTLMSKSRPANGGV